MKRLAPCGTYVLPTCHSVRSTDAGRKRVRTEANVSTGWHFCFLTVAFQNFRELTLIVYLTALTVSEPLLQLVIPIGWKIADVTEIADVTDIVTSAILVPRT